jgi:hypothetical protein
VASSGELDTERQDEIPGHPVFVRAVAPNARRRHRLDLSQRFLYRPTVRLDVLIVPAGGATV